MPLCLAQGQLDSPALGGDEVADLFAISAAPLLDEEMIGGCGDPAAPAASEQPHAAAQAREEQMGLPSKADRQPRKVIRAKRRGSRGVPTQQVRLLMVCRSLACWDYWLASCLPLLKGLHGFAPWLSDSDPHGSLTQITTIPARPGPLNSLCLAKQLATLYSSIVASLVVTPWQTPTTCSYVAVGSCSLTPVQATQPS